jgi:hypothetical protein
MLGYLQLKIIGTSDEHEHRKKHWKINKKSEQPLINEGFVCKHSKKLMIFIAMFDYRGAPSK